jgi:hypothetical protein
MSNLQFIAPEFLHGRNIPGIAIIEKSVDVVGDEGELAGQVRLVHFASLAVGIYTDGPDSRRYMKDDAVKLTLDKFLNDYAETIAKAVSDLRGLYPDVKKNDSFCV